MRVCVCEISLSGQFFAMKPAAGPVVAVAAAGTMAAAS